jgi:hypothetical protein
VPKPATLTHLRLASPRLASRPPADDLHDNREFSSAIGLDTEVEDAFKRRLGALT